MVFQLQIQLISQTTISFGQTMVLVSGAWNQIILLKIWKIILKLIVRCTVN